MTLLDPFTIILMSTLTATAMSVVLFSAEHSFPAEIKGLRQWALGLLGLVAAALCLTLRGTLPQIVMLLGVNFALVGGIGLSLIGTQLFYGRRPGWLLLAALLTLSTAGIAYFGLVRPDISLRVATFSLLVFLPYALQVRLIILYGERNFSTYFFGGLMLLQALMVLLRGAVALAGGPGSNLAQPGLFQSVYLALANFMALLLAVGFMTVATRRLQIILERRSTLDPLTQTLNRRGFADIYAKERAQLRRESRVMAMLSIDLDFFKLINDRYGHAMGDRVLVHVAQVIARALRESDHLARFGGEEFVLLLPDTGVDRAVKVAERIQAALREPRVAEPGVSALPFYTVSIGIACQQSAEEDLDGILMRADAALYRAKANGRNRIELAQPSQLPMHARWVG